MKTRLEYLTERNKIMGESTIDTDMLDAVDCFWFETMRRMRPSKRSAADDYRSRLARQASQFPRSVRYMGEWECKADEQEQPK